MQTLILITIIVMVILSQVQLANAEIQIPFWVKEKIKWWSDDKLPSSDLDPAFSWLAEKNQITLKTSDSQQIPQWLKLDGKKWRDGKISDKAFFDKIYSGLKDGSIKTSVKSKYDSKSYKEHEYSGYSPLFRTFAYKKDFYFENGKPFPRDLQFETKLNLTAKYDEIKSFGKNSVVVIPIFTSTAYHEPGFYTYYRGECDAKCLTKKIEYGKYHGYSGSSNAVKILTLLGYKTITDIDVDKNPKILSKFKKVIVLHNEYVTKREFDAITTHPNVLYLYPNALYAEVQPNYKDNTITLVRGHNYPSQEIRNGFNWMNDNSQQEYDKLCTNWKFQKMANGTMLNCYPEDIIFNNIDLLKAIKNY